MTIEELNARIGLTICEIDDISIVTEECTKLSIEFTISVLEEVVNNGNWSTPAIEAKIQKLKAYLKDE